MEFHSINNPIVHFDRNTDPYGWIQWKGTDVCVDVHCSCGALLHFDGKNFYYVRCSECKRVYEVSGYVQLIPIDAAEVQEMGFFPIVEATD